MTGSEVSLESKEWAEANIIATNKLLHNKLTIRLQKDPMCILDGVLK